MSSTKRRARKSDASKPPGPTKTVAPVTPMPIQGFDPHSFAAANDELRSHLVALVRQVSVLNKACDGIHAAGPLAALSQTDAAATLAETAEELTARLEPLRTVLGGIRTRLDEWRHAERNSRRSRFEEGAKTNSWTVVGSWPEPVVNGVAFVVVDEPKDRATVNGRLLPGVPTAERLIDGCQAALADLENQQTEPAAFVASLWKAFRGCGGKPGAGIGVFDLLRELTWQRQSKSFVRDPRTDLFRGYGVAQFRADLTHYLRAGAPPIQDGKVCYRLEVVGGSFSQDGIFMYFPQTQRLATCGRLTFQVFDEGGDQP